MKKGIQLVICPKCSKAIPMEDIDAHVQDHSLSVQKPNEHEAKSTGA